MTRLRHRRAATDGVASFAGWITELVLIDGKNAGCADEWRRDMGGTGF